MLQIASFFKKILILCISEIECLLPIFDGGILIVDESGNQFDESVEFLPLDSVIHLTCGEGYKYVGDETSVCQRDETFTPTKGECIG